MRKHSNVEVHEVFMNSACIAAHASYEEEGGFRQRDLRFYVDMFSNWVDVTLENHVLSLQNTQIMRFLNDLVKKNFATRSNKGGQPRYRLNRLGLTHLVGRLAQRKPKFPIEHFYFVFHIIETYRGPIERLILDGANRWSPAHRNELSDLFDIRKSLDEHIAFVSAEYAKLQQRIEDSKSVEKIVNKGRQVKKSTDAIVEEIEKEFPYDLNSQKTLSKFYREIPAFMRDFILDIAIPRRRDHCWAPIASSLQNHLRLLNELRNSLKK